MPPLKLVSSCTTLFIMILVCLEYKKSEVSKMFVFCGDKKVGKTNLIYKLLDI